MLMIRNYLFAAVFLLNYAFVNGQTYTTNFRTTDKNIKVEENVEDKYIWLFDDFKKAIIHVDNKYSEYWVNYKLTIDAFVAKDEDGNSQILSQNFNMDSLVIEDRVFIYHPQYRYLEKLEENGNAYYIKYQTTYMLEEIKQGGYGDALASASVQSVNILAGQGEGIPTRGNSLYLPNASGNPVSVHLTTNPVFGVILNDTFETIDSRRDLIKTFPYRKSEIRTFLRRNKIKFDVRDDIITLIGFLSEKNK